MVSVWFVTPAWQRYALTAVCLEQRLRVIERLAQEGIEGRCVVVADDENLDIARGFGFDVVERDNEWLGRRFNDGMEYAGRHGATWIVPIGSDSWIDPEYLLPLPMPGVTRTAAQYAVVASDRIAACAVQNASGAGPYLFHRDLLALSGFRPAKDAIRRHVDSSTIAGLRSSPNWRWRKVHPFQYVGFRGTPHITPYSRLVAKWGKAEHSDPAVWLTRSYPADLVERALAALGPVAVAA